MTNKQRQLLDWWNRPHGLADILKNQALLPKRSYVYLISCDRCKTFNPKGDTNYLCAVEGLCPGMEEDPVKRKLMYVHKQHLAIAVGDAMRIDERPSQQEEVDATCGDCGNTFSDMANTTSIADHGRCFNCHKKWQHSPHNEEEE